MTFWNNISQKASETTAKAVQKAKEMSDIARLNSMISEEETKINNNYYQLGKLYVTMHSNDHEEEFAGMIDSIAEAEEKIKNYRQQIQDIKGVVRCSQCGAEVQSGVAFCSSCGAPIPKIEKPVPDDSIRCESCGSIIKRGMRFCTTCGKPISEAYSINEADSPAEIHTEEDTQKICPACGAKMEPDLAFCTECGTKLN